jgi:two-component system NtrC family sensor kinase
VARRWRIRHKLLLGLATATAILFLILAGTLNGLWSYYVTMKVIEAKLKEMDKAEVLKTTINDLTLKGGPFLETVYNLRDRDIIKAEKALSDFEVEFQTTLSRELTSDDGVQIAGLIVEIREKLAKLRTSCNVPERVLIGEGQRDPDIAYQKDRENIQVQLKELERASADLRSGIREMLKVRIEHSRRHYQITLAVLISISVLSLLLIGSAWHFFYGWICTPVRDLQEGVTRVAQGNFEHRIEVHSGDEMEELAAAYNDMTRRLFDLYRDMARQINERSRQLVRSERLASVGFLAAGVAHEINNPLASIAFCSEALEARLEELREQLTQAGRGLRDADVFSKYLKMIQEEAFRCKNITERLLEVSRNGENKRDRIDMAELVQSVLEVTQHHPTSKGKEIVFTPAGSVFAWVCAEEIKSVVLNLVFNALESMEEGGKLMIDLRSKDDMAELMFTDTGCGMTQEVLDNIFEPFFTRSRSGKGTGLGLTITHRIISQHGGEIEAGSPGANEGSTFRVRLPLQPPVEATTEENLGQAA